MENQTRALVAALLSPKDLEEGKQSELRPITKELIKSVWEDTVHVHSSKKVVGFLFSLLKELYPEEYMGMTVLDTVDTGPGTLHTAALHFMQSQSIRVRQVKATYLNIYKAVKFENPKCVRSGERSKPGRFLQK